MGFADGVDHCYSNRMMPFSTATSQHGRGSKAGAESASPVRKLKQAWCQGQRTDPSVTRPEPSGPSRWVQAAPIAKAFAPWRTSKALVPAMCPFFMPPSVISTSGMSAARSGPGSSASLKEICSSRLVYGNLQ